MLQALGLRPTGAVPEEVLGARCDDGLAATSRTGPRIATLCGAACVKDNTVRPGASSPVLAVLPPTINFNVELPDELPTTIVIDSPIEWAALFFGMWLLIKLNQRQ
jgi:hypothetical protein